MVTLSPGHKGIEVPSAGDDAVQLKAETGGIGVIFNILCTCLSESNEKFQESKQNSRSFYYDKVRSC